MNYLRIYNEIIEKRKNIKATGLTEKHHILPKSLFPQRSKDKSNIVSLTVRQHYICHWLLTKIYKHNRKMWFAFWNMNLCRDYKNSKAFERMKKQVIGKFKGQNNPMYGRKAVNQRPVRWVQMNIVFQSMTDAAALFNITKQAIRAACIKNRICKGKHFEFVEKKLS